MWLPWNVIRQNTENTHSLSLIVVFVSSMRYTVPKLPLPSLCWMMYLLASRGGGWGWRGWWRGWWGDSASSSRNFGMVPKSTPRGQRAVVCSSVGSVLKNKRVNHLVGFVLFCRISQLSTLHVEIKAQQQNKTKQQQQFKSYPEDSDHICWTGWMWSGSCFRV